MNDIRVATWSELMGALYDIPRSPHQRFRSTFVYRGVGDKSWGLEPSLKRLGGEYEKVEGPLLRAFRKYAQPGSIPGDTIWIRLSVAQHYGLPTRLLDWTISPKVALHFATAEQEQYGRDGGIWCVDVEKARELLPTSLREVLDREYAFLLSVEMLDFISALSDFDHLAREGDFVLFFEPPSLDARIVNQGAIMSVMPGATRALDEFLIAHPEIYQRIVIAKELKWEIRDKLDQDNVTERMLFPGLDGLSRWLRRYYGPGPNQP